MSRYLIAASALVLLIAAAWLGWHQEQALQEARGAAWHSTQLAKADSARADSAEARADSAEARARAHIAKAKVIYIAAPDTCKPFIKQAVHEVKSAYHEEKKAAGELRAASGIRERSVTDLRSTEKRLIDASKPSFLSHFVPSVGVGATAGIDPFTRKPATAVGVTLSWRLH